MPKMLGLRDVHPRHERVDIGGGVFIDVTAIPSRVLFALLDRFPQLFEKMGTARGLKDIPEDMVVAIITACTREYEDVEAEKRAGDLSLAARVKLLNAMGRTTFPDGFGPFLADLRSLSGGMLNAVEVIIKESATTSPKPPKPSVQQETPPSGT